MGKIKSILSYLIPPIFLNIYRNYLVKSTNNVIIAPKRKTNEYWDGNYESWEAAEKLCAGYDSDIIVNKCFESIQKVIKGEAVYERDSVLFEKNEYSFGIISSLFLIAQRCHNHLSVLDFGGSLGSSYYQNKEFLSYFETCQWTIIEQEKFYQLGRKYISNNQLQFLETIEECLEQNTPNLFLISSSLQYISKPIEILKKINTSNIQFVVFDRIPFSESENFITIQTVPPIIYEASYPCWIFNYDWLLKQLPNYKVIFEFPSFCDADQIINDGLLVQWKGITLELI